MGRNFGRLALASLGFGMFSNQMWSNKKRNDALSCCGIIAYVGKKNEALGFLTDGIRRVKNRGYDSAGVVSVTEEKTFQCTKLASDANNSIDSIEKVALKVLDTHTKSRCGIGHTRWATCGGISDRNAHPHMDWKERIALVHNGTLSNVEELREELSKHNIPLKSETDSELIAHFIGLGLDEGLSLFESTKKVLGTKIHGTWGLVVIKKDEPEKLVVSRVGSPIVIAMGTDSLMVGSESIVFQNYTNNFFRLEENEILEVDCNKLKEFSHSNKARVQDLFKVNPADKPTPPFESFFDQETMEQPTSASKAMNDGGRLCGERGTTKLGGLEANVKPIQEMENLQLIGCGTSYHAALAALRTFKHFKCADTVQAIEASEFTIDDLPNEKGCGIFISQSGETFDVKRALEAAKSQGMFTIGVVNVPGSMIASAVHCGSYLNCGREVAVAATKSFTSQVIVLLLIAIWIAHKKNGKKQLDERAKFIEYLYSLPMLIGRTLFQVDASCRKLGPILSKDHSIYILGKGPSVAIAKEAALKIKEITYVHADGYPAGELKHGTLALIDVEHPGTTKVFLIILDDEYLHDMQLALSEVKSRSAYTIVITDCKHLLNQSKIDECIEIPSAGPLTFLLAILPFHKITLYLAKELKRNIDQPRNLAKTVTVG